ncbi:MAG: sugar kinase [Anaerolineae bacterium]|nr:sugar kinase [Anaerolineae bacterium]
MAFDVTTFGESMLRLSVPEGVRLQAATQLDAHPAGAEANVASLLARLERRTAWHSSLPENALGRLVADHLHKAGVDTGGVIWQPQGRLGTYYVEFAAPPRAIQVIYDRADSCVTRVTPDLIRWDHLLDTRLVHLTGITPPLSPSCAAVVKAIIVRAREHGVAISFDVNYRAKLWTEADARDWLTPVVQGIDLLFCNQADARRIFSINAAPEQAITALAERVGAKQVVMSLGEQGAFGWDGTTVYHQPALPVRIIDRIGAGDSLASGVIHGWLDGDLDLGLRYGVALAALALSQHGDAVITTPQELAGLIAQTHGGSAVVR